MLYGYARCSTNEKKQDVQYQVRLLGLSGVKDDDIYIEYESGAKTSKERREWAKVLKLLKPKDTLFTTEVSHMCRSTKQLCDIIAGCVSGVAFFLLMPKILKRREAELPLTE